MRRLPGRRRQREARPARDPARRHPRRRRHPAAAAAGRPGAAPRTSSSPAGSSTPQEALRDRPGRPGRAGRRRLHRGARDGRPVRRRPGAAPCAPPRRPSTAASRPTSTTGLELERLQFAGLFATEDREDRHGVVRRARPRQGDFTGTTVDATAEDVSAPNPNPTADEVERAWTDPKLANVLYHDWEASTYDEKWSISYDERCIDYARDRFVAAVGRDDMARWPYGEALELGSGTGFFLLNLMQAGVVDQGPRHRPVARHGRGRGAQRHRARPRRRRPGRGRGVDPVRRRQRRPRRRPRGAAPHPGRRARAARGAARAAGRAAGSSSPASRPRSATGTPAGSAG